MPSLLNYAVVTDPVSLPASQPGAPSVGKVYVIISNPHLQPVTWNSIEVELPGGLTSRPEDIEASVEIDPLSPVVSLGFIWDSAKRVFQVVVPPRLAVTMSPRDSIILKLENVAVSAADGLALLKIREVSWGGDDGRDKPSAGEFYGVTFGLVKSAPKVPRNFRPDRSTVDVDAGDNVVLRWDGPDNLDYWIQYPDGQRVLAQQRSSGSEVTQRGYEWTVSPTPKRGATYTLVAGTDNPVQEGYFLTTTVHARIPEFESGVRTPWVEGTPNKSRVAFSPGGVEVTSGGGWGTITVGEAKAMKGLRTKWVWGLDDEDGWIDFPSSGINVYHGTSHSWGTVSADKADVNGVRTKWVWGRADADGWIEFPESGVNVFHGPSRDWGTVAADKADLNDLVTGGAQVKKLLYVHGQSVFEKWAEFRDGIVVTYDEHGNVWISKQVGGLSVRVGNLHVDGKISQGTSDRGVRYL